MKRYTLLVASIDDFKGTAEDLALSWQDEDPHVYSIDFDAPDNVSARTVTLIGRGLMWEDQWTSQGTVSTIIEDVDQEDTRPLCNSNVVDDDRHLYEDASDTLDEHTNAMSPDEPEDFAGSIKHIDIYSYPSRSDEWDDKVNW